MNREVKISKKLSYLLRHTGPKFGLEIDTYGYALLSDVLKLSQLNQLAPTQNEIENIVKSNDKQRFTLMSRNNDTYIRANQGHSIKVDDLDLTEITDASQYPIIVHGTYQSAWNIIKNKGLSKMARNHIHFAQGVFGSENVISGMRSTCEVLIYIDLAKAMAANIKFYVSSNGVILSPGINGIIASEYFSTIDFVNK